MNQHEPMFLTDDISISCSPMLSMQVIETNKRLEYTTPTAFSLGLVVCCQPPLQWRRPTGRALGSGVRAPRSPRIFFPSDLLSKDLIPEEDCINPSSRSY